MHKIQLCIHNWDINKNTYIKSLKEKCVLKQAAMHNKCCVILFNPVELEFSDSMVFDTQ